MNKVYWIVYKEGSPHFTGTSKDVADFLNITPNFVRNIAYRKVAYKNVYTIKRKET